MIEYWLRDAWIFFGMDIGMLVAIFYILARRYKDEN
jgi:hypothetical protein